MDVLIPTYNRPASLAVTLAGLASCQMPLRVVVADQSDTAVNEGGEVQALLRTLVHSGHEVELHRRPERRGVAEQRDFLLSRAGSEYVLCLDDDIWLQPWAIPTMVKVARRLNAGLVGMAPIGLSYTDDVRPHEWRFFDPVAHATAETVRRGQPAWKRYELHNAANPLHLAHHVDAHQDRPVAYRIAWIGGCVLYRRSALEAVGGFRFWADLPAVHAGEDVVAQLRVMQKYGAVGVLPSGAIHLELPTTISDRQYEAYDVVGID